MDVIEDVACTRCGCVCDDLRMTVEDGRITSVRGACHLSEDWFLNQESINPPIALIGNKAVPLDSAINQAVEVLTAARFPLIYGLSRSSTAGQRAAARLADAIGGNIDTSASLCHGPSIMAIQQVGESTCSLGEIKNRADLVIFWGVDPTCTHPRHFERYSLDPVGMFVPQGRRDRTIIVIDSETTESAKAADVFVQVDRDRDFEMLWALRALLQGLPLEGDSHAGIECETLIELMTLMRSCRSGVFFFGLGLAHKRTGPQNVEALLRLTRELNCHTRFYAQRMRLHGDVTGADMVLCWQTGYPFSVNLSRGYPRYNPGEYSANDLLERGEVDACLLVGGESLPEMTTKAKEHFHRIPTILLEYPTVEAPLEPSIKFTTSVYGIHLRGTVYRMDEVPIPLRQVLPSKYPSDADILNEIRRSVMRP